jgi:uncharacterized protein (TIGR03118 family)
VDVKKRVCNLVKLICALAVSISPGVLSASTVFFETNLVSNVPGLATNTDPNLIDPWGISFSATSPFWVSNQNSGNTTFYDGAGNPVQIGGNSAITIPGGASGTAGPTAQVNNSTTGFAVNGTPAHFIFANLDGTIAAWASGVNAVTTITTPGATYTGLALASSGGSNYLYAADSTAFTGEIRVFNSSYQPVTLAGNFTDPNALIGYVPFNIQLIGTQLYVAYALLNPDGSSQPGGYVDIFNTDGTFVSRFATGGVLNAPWGFALAPSTFGSFGGDLLIANNGNGWINAFNPTTGAFVGTLDGTNGNPLVFQDLWAIDFRTGGTNVNTSALYFAEGINNDTGGVFGELTVAAPEPSTLALFGLGVLAFALLARRRSVVTRTASLR